MPNNSTNPRPGVVYAQTNERDANQLLVFDRAPDGTLVPSGAHETRGSGDGMPHLTSQGSVMLTGGGRHLLVANAGSGEVSLFAIGEGAPVLLQTVPTGGAPKSIAQRGDLVYVSQHGAPLAERVSPLGQPTRAHS